MASKHPYSNPGREAQPKPTFIEWPAKVIKAPTPLPGQKKKKK
jgi:hypothetical protein